MCVTLLKPVHENVTLHHPYVCACVCVCGGGGVGWIPSPSRGLAWSGKLHFA